MGLVYMKDKPEAESFQYAYVEDADGNLVRVAVENMKATLGIVDPMDVKITLDADGWVLSADAAYYTQELTIDGATVNSKVELQPTIDQLVQLMNDEITIFIGNEDGVITAYSVNGKPSEDMTFDARITEVS